MRSIRKSKNFKILLRLKMQKNVNKCVFGLVLSLIWLKYVNFDAFGQKIDIWFGKMYLNHLELYSYINNEKYMPIYSILPLNWVLLAITTLIFHSF